MPASSHWAANQGTWRGSKSCLTRENSSSVAETHEGTKRCRRATAAITRLQAASWLPRARSARPSAEPCCRAVRTVALPQRDQRQLCLPGGADGGRDASASPRLSGRALRGIAENGALRARRRRWPLQVSHRTGGWRVRLRAGRQVRPIAPASPSLYRDGKGGASLGQVTGSWPWVAGLRG